MSEDLIVKEIETMRKQSDRYERFVDKYGIGFNVSFCSLGVVALVLNTIVLYVILSQKQKTFKSAFYMLLANVAVTDILRSLCMLFWAFRAIHARTVHIADKVVVYLLRFFNVIIVLNLLLLTLNEYFSIRYPVQYKRYDSPSRATLVPVVFSWLLAFLAVGVTVWVRKSTPPLYLIRNDGNFSWPRGAVSANATSHWLKTNEGAEIHNCMLGGVELSILLFCFICFAMIVTCYVWFLRKLRQRRNDLKFGTEIPFLRIHFGTQRYVSTEDTMTTTSRVLLRYKYILVIGLVLIVYSFYLLSYAAITLLQYVRIKRGTIGFDEELVPIQAARWCLQLAFVLHSIFQPLCYLRFRQFCQMTLRTFAQPPTPKTSYATSRQTSLRQSNADTNTSL